MAPEVKLDLGLDSPGRVFPVAVRRALCYDIFESMSFHVLTFAINRYESAMSTPNDGIYATQPPSADPSGAAFAHDNRSTTTPNQPNYHYQHYYQPPQQGIGCTGFLLRTFLVMVALFFCVFVGMIMISSMIVAVTGSMEQFGQQENTLSEKHVRGEKTAKPKIAIITVNGMIAGSEDGFVARQIRQVAKDTDVAAVVLRVESPGGTMSGSDYYHHLLKGMKEEREFPVIVSMGAIAASGGYYIAVAGDEIYAEPSTITGSIGVIVSLYNAAELMEKVGVEPTPITSGPLKTMGSFSKKLTDEERLVWQRLVDDNFNRFKQVIREGRKAFAEDPEKLDQLATGQVFAATEAKANQLVDEIGYLDDAIDKAMSQAGLNENNSKVIRYRPKKTFTEILLESRATEKTLCVETLVDMTTPKIYMLCPQVVPIQGISSDR